MTFDSTLFRATGEIVPTPTGRTVSSQPRLRKIEMESSRRKAHTATFVSIYYWKSNRHTVGLADIEIFFFLTEWRETTRIFFAAVVCFLYEEKKTVTPFISAPFQSLSDANVTWHRSKHSCSTPMVKASEEWTHVVITGYMFSPCFMRGHQGVISRQTKSDVNAPLP